MTHSENQWENLEAADRLRRKRGQFVKRSSSITFAREDEVSKGSFAQHVRDETMPCRTQGRLISFNKGLGSLKTKSGSGVPVKVLGGDFVMRVLSSLVKK